MWNQQPPAWGWPQMGYQQYQEPEDVSQGWAAAAAMWAQQRQMQEQYQQQGNRPPPAGDKPPEPPGPPPQMPPLPGGETADPSQQQVEVHDYMHGQTSVAEVVDYQHGNGTENDVPDVIDYNHGKTDEHALPEVSLPEVALPEGQEQQQTWDYNNGQAWAPSYPVPEGYFNNEWNAEQQWNGQQWNQEQWNAEQANYFQEMPVQNESHNTGRSNKPRHKHNLQPSGFHSQLEEYRGSGQSSPDLSEIAKKSKSLPLWLRQGLEKLENDKKKTNEKVKEKDDIPNAKLISGYQMATPPSSPERDQEDSDQEELPSRSSRSPQRINKSHTFDERRKSVASNDEDSDDEDDEEKQRNLILKIKTWMTEILLGVTNNGLKEVCKEVYFETKRSAKTKGQQLRSSGGLDALRSSLGGGGSSSEEESEDEKPVPIKRPVQNKINGQSNTIRPVVIRPVVINDTRNHEADRSINSSSRDTGKRLPIERPTEPRQPSVRESKKKPQENSTVKTETSDHRTQHRIDVHEEELKRRLIVIENKLKQKDSKESTSEDEKSDNETTETSESNSSSDNRRKKKRKKRNRSYSRSPSRKKNKKSKRYEHNSSSSDEDRKRKKKKKRERSPSSDDSDRSYRKKKSKGKKQKRKDRSVSRSPPHHKRRR